MVTRYNSSSKNPMVTRRRNNKELISSRIPVLIRYLKLRRGREWENPPQPLLIASTLCLRQFFETCGQIRRMRQRHTGIPYPNTILSAMALKSKNAQRQGKIVSCLRPETLYPHNRRKFPSRSKKK
jgi:hypothetical protein